MNTRDHVGKLWSLCLLEADCIIRPCLSTTLTLFAFADYTLTSLLVRRFRKVVPTKLRPPIYLIQPSTLISTQPTGSSVCPRQKLFYFLFSFTSPLFLPPKLASAKSPRNHGPYPPQFCLSARRRQLPCSSKRRLTDIMNETTGEKDK